MTVLEQWRRLHAAGWTATQIADAFGGRVASIARAVAGHGKSSRRVRSPVQVPLSSSERAIWRRQEREDAS